MPSSRGSSSPRDGMPVFTFPSLAGGFFVTSTTWEAHSQGLLNEVKSPCEWSFAIWEVAWLADGICGLTRLQGLTISLSRNNVSPSGSLKELHPLKPLQHEQGLSSRPPRRHISACCVTRPLPDPGHSSKADRAPTADHVKEVTHQGSRAGNLLSVSGSIPFWTCWSPGGPTLAHLQFILFIWSYREFWTVSGFRNQPSLSVVLWGWACGWRHPFFTVTYLWWTRSKASAQEERWGACLQEFCKLGDHSSDSGHLMGFPGSVCGKEPSCQCRRHGDVVQSLGQEEPLEEGMACPCLENPMDRGAWWATVHGVSKSQTWLSN